MEVSSSSSSSSEKSAEVIPPTKFEEAELIPQAEWRAMRERFPYAVRKSCTKYKKGQLEAVTDEELGHRLATFKGEDSTIKMEDKEPIELITDF